MEPHAVWKRVFYNVSPHTIRFVSVCHERYDGFCTGTKNEYKQIVFSNNGNLYQSYMFYLFYSSFDPNLYQILGGSVSGGYDKPHRLKRILSFRSVDWTKEELKAGTLYVSDSKNAPSQKRIVNIFRNLDGKEAIIAFTL